MSECDAVSDCRFWIAVDAIPAMTRLRFDRLNNKSELFHARKSERRHDCECRP